MASFTEHKLWPQLRPYVRLIKYARDGGRAKPRIRIEFAPMPDKLRAKALAATSPCVACGSPINPVRARAAASKRADASAGLYFAAACPLSVNVGCSRGEAAKDEYRKVAADVGES